jgi:hypothetical protein
VRKENGMRKLILGIVMPIFLQSAPAKAGEVVSAGDLYDYCRDSHPVGQMVCKFYIMGAVQGIALTAAKLNDTRVFCIPDDIGDKQLVALYIKTVQNDFLLYPDDKKEPAISLIAAVVMQAFKCTNSK